MRSETAPSEAWEGTLEDVELETAKPRRRRKSTGREKGVGKILSGEGEACSEEGGYERGLGE